MSIQAPEPAERADARSLFSPFRFSVEQFHELGESGYFPYDKKIELIDGIPNEMHPPGPFHCSVTLQISQLLEKSASAKISIRREFPLVLNSNSELVPDIVVAKKRPDDPFFASAHTDASESFLVIEVSKSTYSFDRSIKYAAYAGAGIPEYWIVNLNEKKVECFTNPDSEASEYREESTLSFDASIKREGFEIDLSKIEF